MTIKEDPNSNDPKKEGYEEDVVVTAVPASPQGNEPPIPAGHARFYCNKCHTPYDLPNQATSWRCMQCMEFNSITQGECEWCTVL